jgi:hypothetical protein
MAKDSIREQILVYHEKYLLGKVKSINHVARIMPTYADLQTFAVTQFPVAAMVGRLPVPQMKRSGRTGHAIDVITSSLKIDNFIYIQVMEDPDTELSDILDDVWAKLYSDLTYGGLVLSTELTPEEETGVWEPFIAFKLTTEVKYTHNTEGI